MDLMIFELVDLNWQHEILTCMTRRFELVPREFELAAREFKSLSCKVDLVTRELELATREFESLD